MSIITKFEQRGRKETLTADGTEVIRTFYLEPYHAHPIIVAALRGGVTTQGRRKPARDTYYPYCYCTSVDVSIDNDLMFADSPTTGYSQGNEDDPLSKAQVALRTKELNFAAGLPQSYEYHTPKGAWITARYVPLIKIDDYIYHAGTKYNVVDNADGPNEIDAFDVLDPLLTPIQKFVSVPRGLVFDVAPLLSFDQETQISQSYGVFTLRRYMVPTIPSITIGLMQGKVNQDEMVFGTYRFPAETMRFRGCDPRKIIVPDVDGNQNVFYDLLYTWDVNMTYGSRYIGTWKESKWEKAFIGWNCALGNYTIGEAIEYMGLGYYRVGSIDSTWQMFNWSSPISPQYPAAELVDAKGFMKLFEWGAP
jgi:hypothetical protein